MYECEAENQFKVSKAFINIDGNRTFSFFYSIEIKIFFRNNFIQSNDQRWHQNIIETSSSYGRFHYIWQMERRLAL